MWKLTAKGKRVVAIPGVPWRDMTDAEFDEASKENDKQFDSAQKGALAKSGFFEHHADKKAEDK